MKELLPTIFQLFQIKFPQNSTLNYLTYFTQTFDLPFFHHYRKPTARRSDIGGEWGEFDRSHQWKVINQSQNPTVVLLEWFSAVFLFLKISFLFYFHSFIWWCVCFFPCRAVDILRTASSTNHMRLLIARDEEARWAARHVAEDETKGSKPPQKMSLHTQTMMQLVTGEGIENVNLIR